MPSTSGPLTQTLQRALQLLEVLVDSRGMVSVSAAAAKTGIKLSTAYRLVAELHRAGMVFRVARGRYSGGVAIYRMAQASNLDTVVVAIARRFLKDLSQQTNRVAHLGVFEDDMVTYLIREAPFENELFTREGMQLEAYCTAVGKVLLAGLAMAEREKYIATGQLIALTAHTLTDPAMLRDQLTLAWRNGFAIDDEESNVGLHCVAVPLATTKLGRLYALSLSGSHTTVSEQKQLLAACQNTAKRLAAELDQRPLAYRLMN